MSLTKGEVVTEAYKLIGFGAVDDADMISEGVVNLERMLHSWWNGFIDTGYTFATTPSAALPADDSTLTPVDEDGVILNLAVKLATKHGVVIGGTLLQDAKSAKDSRYQLSAPSIATNPLMPVGAGGSRHNSRVKYQTETEQAEILAYGGNPLEG